MTTRPMKPLAEYIPTPAKRATRSYGAPTCCCCGAQAGRSRSYVMSWQEGGEYLACTLDHISDLTKQHPGKAWTLDELQDIYPDKLVPKYLGRACLLKIYKQTPGAYIISTKGGARYLFLS